MKSKIIIEMYDNYTKYVSLLIQNGTTDQFDFYNDNEFLNSYDLNKELVENINEGPTFFVNKDNIKLKLSFQQTADAFQFILEPIDTIIMKKGKGEFEVVDLELYIKLMLQLSKGFHIINLIARC